MCTGAMYRNNTSYFGRNLDYEISYGNEVVFTPRKFPISFKKEDTLTDHYAILGMALVAEDYPLYFDGFNEKGLGMAGLNFVGNADYKECVDGKANITPFEFIPWVLGQCATVKEAVKLIESMNMVNIPFSDKLGLSELHWLIGDKTDCIVVESVKDRIHIYDNPAEVLTNNPPFPFQLFNLNNYIGLDSKDPDNTFSDHINLNRYSRGMGTMGLPGDVSSQSRFVKAAFVRAKGFSEDDELSNVSEFFHILTSVEQQRGLCELPGKKYEITLYSDCCSLDKGIYYYKTYDNHQLMAVDMNKENLDGAELKTYPYIEKGEFKYLN